MIPKNINKNHVIEAIKKVESGKIPKGRRSKKFLLKYDGKYYPPKYIISLANKYANGRELDSSELSGGKETNSFLRALGFNIVEISPNKRTILKPLREGGRKRRPKFSHDERCPKCKETIQKLLEKIYGKVEPTFKFEIGTHPEDFRNAKFYGKLKEIFVTLQNHRGFKEFIRARTLPNCDFFVPDPRFVLEFDESQHFTLPRRITLEHYPKTLDLGFSIKKWVTLCEKINAKDNNPPYRDEQRAWYDTLRDFLPSIKGLEPTTRIFSKDFAWCSLNPNNPSDVEKFRGFLKGKSRIWKIEIKEEQNPVLARVIIASRWKGKPEEAKSLLEDIHEKWPSGKRVKFLLTCGGFIQFNWLKGISRWATGNNKHSNRAVETLSKEAEKYANFVLSDGLDDKLRQLTDFITLGIDSYKEKISTTQNYISQPHIELVFLINLKNKKFYWTGKSYPTTRQQDGLVRNCNLSNHFIELENVGKVMILGCHDLNMFSNRNWKKTGEWRREIKTKFRTLAKKEKPIYVLHHPHTTVNVRTWLNAWSSLKKMIPTVEECAGAGRYYEPDKEPSKWDKLDDVLKTTKSERTDTVDFIVHDLI